MKHKAVQYFKNITSAKVLAVLFLVFSLYVGSAGFSQFFTSSVTAIKSHQSLSEYISTVNEQYEGMLTTAMGQKLLHNKGTYINTNGFMANLMGQPEMNERFKLTNGYLHRDITIEDATVETAYQNLLALYEHQAERGKHFLFVMSPSPVYDREELLPANFTDTANLQADRLLAMLENSGVPYLDLRQELVKEGITTQEAFFVTDHHWKPETGLWAYGRILEALAENGGITPVDTAYTDPDNFRYTVYEDAFLGSSGKRTGIYYAGVDDFCVITPKFETEISLEIASRDLQITGSYEEAALRSDVVAICEKKDYFNQNPYAAYGWSDNGHTCWRNENAPELQKVLLIGDSYGNVPFSFMSLYFSSCDELDMRHFKKDFAEYYEEFQPDHMIVLINLSGFSGENLTYDYFPEAVS